MILTHYPKRILNIYYRVVLKLKMPSLTVIGVWSSLLQPHGIGEIIVEIIMKKKNIYLHDNNNIII